MIWTQPSGQLCLWQCFFQIPILVTVEFYWTTIAIRITMIIRKGNHFEEVVRCLRILSISTISPGSQLRDRKCQLFFINLSLTELLRKHCQRHNGPEGWVHITSSNTNLDQISSSESQSNISLSIKLKLQNLDQT